MRLALIATIFILLWACGPSSDFDPTFTPEIFQDNSITPTHTSSPLLTPTQSPSPTLTREPFPTPSPMATRMISTSATIIPGIDDTAQALAWSKDGTWLYIGTDSSGLVAYNVIEGKLGPFVGNNATIQSLAISPDGNILAAGLANDGSIRLISTVTGGLDRTIFPAHTDWVQGLAFSPDGKYLASAGDDGNVILWDATTGSEYRRLLEDGAAIKEIAFTPDGLSLVTAAQFEYTTYVWDTRSWDLTITFSGDQAQDLDICPDGTRLVTAGGGIHEANIWDLSSGEHLLNLREMPGWTWAVDCAPDGKMAAAGGIGLVVVLFDTTTGEPAIELYTGPDFIQALEYSPDGSMLAIGGAEQVILWPISADD